MSSKTVDLGYFTDGYNVVFATAEVAIRRVNRESQTVAHLPIESYSELAISGMLRQVTNGRRVGNGIAFGQIDMSLRDMQPCDRFGNPEPISDKTRRLMDIWDLWHLNGMHANCMHQSRTMPKLHPVWLAGTKCGWEPPIVWEVHRAIESAKCPCGYKYGSAWLVDVLPPAIHDWYRQL